MIEERKKERKKDRKKRKCERWINARKFSPI